MIRFPIPWRTEDHPDARRLEKAPECVAELPVPVENQESLRRQDAIDHIGQVPRDLLHEVLARTRRASDDLDGAGREIDHEERVPGHEPPCRPHLRREEVGRRDRAELRPQELPPRRLRSTFRNRVDAVRLEDVADRRRRDVMAEVCQSADDPVVSPSRILARHAQHERRDPPHHVAATGSSARKRPLHRDQRAVPPQDRLRRHDVRELLQYAATESSSTNREARSVGIGETEPATSKLALQDAVLFLQVLEDALLLAVDPAGEDDRHDLKDGRHGARNGSGVSSPTNGRAASVRYTPSSRSHGVPRWRP
jgi:hypothetical protein